MIRLFPNKVAAEQYVSPLPGSEVREGETITGWNIEDWPAGHVIRLYTLREVRGRILRFTRFVEEE